MEKSPIYNKYNTYLPTSWNFIWSTTSKKFDQIPDLDLPKENPIDSANKSRQNALLRSIIPPNQVINMPSIQSK